MGMFHPSGSTDARGIELVRERRVREGSGGGSLTVGTLSSDGCRVEDDGAP